MTHSEAARLSRLSKAQLQAEIDALADNYRPKVIRWYMENGHKVSIIAAAYAEGAQSSEYCKRTSGGYKELC